MSKLSFATTSGQVQGRPVLLPARHPA